MISVIVPSSGDHHSVELLCESILQQNLLEDYEVLVVSNPPNSHLKNMIAKLPSQFLYFESRERGANTARNIGIKNARGRYLFFFDSDCILETPDFLKFGCEFLDQNPEVMATGGPYRPVRRLRSNLEKAYYYIQSKWLYEGLREDGWHNYLIGGNMQFRREVFQKFGMFDEKLRFGGTETEFFRRMAPAKILFFPERSVFHDYEIHFWEFVKKAFLQGVGRSYIEKLYGTSDGSAFRYGQKAFLKDLGLAALPASGIAWYTRSFEAGERYFRKNGFTKPHTLTILWEVLNTYWSKKHNSSSRIDQWLCITENFRRKFGSK